MFGFPINNFTDEDAVVFCFGGALYSLSGVNCIPGNGIRNPVFTTQVPGDDRPAMDSNAYPDRNTRVRFQFAVDRLKLSDHAQSAQHRYFFSMRNRDRRSENHENLIADKLFDDALLGP